MFFDLDYYLPELDVSYVLQVNPFLFNNEFVYGGRKAQIKCPQYYTGGNGNHQNYKSQISSFPSGKPDYLSKFRPDTGKKAGKSITGRFRYCMRCHLDSLLDLFMRCVFPVSGTEFT
jgi:hypothetical protein